MCFLAGFTIGLLVLTKLAIHLRAWRLVRGLCIVELFLGLIMLLAAAHEVRSERFQWYTDPVWWEILNVSIVSLATAFWAIRNFRNRHSMSPGPFGF